MSEMDGSATNGQPGTGAENGAQSTSWTSGLAEEALGFVQAKGWSDPGSMVDSYRNLEKLIGVPQDQLLRLPKDDSPEEWGKVYERLGRPAEAKDYDITIPEGIGDAEFASKAKDWFHEAGLSSRQAKVIVDKWNEHIAGMQSARTESAKAQAAQIEAALKQEWGAKYEHNVALVEKAASEFGMSQEQLVALRNAMGPADAMRFMANLGSKLGEDKFEAGTGGSKGGIGPMTPSEANARIKYLQQDSAWVKRYLDGDAAARDEMSRLQMMALGR